MHGLVPLARCINGVTEQSQSRIPHLLLHLIRKQVSKSGRSKLLDPQSRLSRRACFSTAVVARKKADFWRWEQGTTPPDNAIDTPVVHPPESALPHLDDGQQSVVIEWDEGQPSELLHRDKGQSSALLQQDEGQSIASLDGWGNSGIARAILEDAIEQNDAERVLLGLVNPETGSDFVQHADNASFSRAICALDPDHFITPLRKLFRYLKPSLETQPKYRVVVSFEERVSSLINILDSVCSQRTGYGHSLDLDVYRHLLKCAAAAGLGSYARFVFQVAMPRDNVRPDLDCHNYQAEAILWNDAHNKQERYRLRVVRPHMLERIKSPAEERRLGFMNFQIASPSNPSSKRSVRNGARQAFAAIVKQGLIPNEESHCNLMVAMGREGDLGSVKKVLKLVWNIDVDALDRSEDAQWLPATSGPRPHGPVSELLLSTVIHVFGINNEIGIGAMLLDHISRKYNLQIPEYTWTQLLEFSYVLSIQHKKQRLEQGFGEGRIARRAVESVYHVFHNKPYSVQPKIEDLIFRVKARLRSKFLYAAIDDIRECLELLRKERVLVDNGFIELYTMFRDQELKDILNGGIPNAKFLAARRKFVMASLRLDQNIQLVSVVIRNMFKPSRWTSADEGTDWAYRVVPNIMSEWKEWLPNIVSYYTPTGHVRILAREVRHAQLAKANKIQTTRAGVYRQLLDTNSPARLRHAVDFLCRHALWRKSDLLEKFQAEIDADQHGVLSDWVSRQEAGAREQRMGDPQVAHAAVFTPGPDRLEEAWVPFGLSYAQNKRKSSAKGGNTNVRSLELDAAMDDLDRALDHDELQS